MFSGPLTDPNGILTLHGWIIVLLILGCGSGLIPALIVIAIIQFFKGCFNTTKKIVTTDYSTISSDEKRNIKMKNLADIGNREKG
jgi:hypothetical protein